MCYFRPGYMDFVRALKNHPRVELGFYSSLMRHNLIPVIMALFPDNEIDAMKWIFDASYCSKMKDHKDYEKIAENEWDTFRDLDKVLADVKVANAGIKRESILLVDSETKKVQHDLNNSLVNIPYEREDV